MNPVHVDNHINHIVHDYTVRANHGIVFRVTDSSEQPQTTNKSLITCTHAQYATIDNWDRSVKKKFTSAFGHGMVVDLTREQMTKRFCQVLLFWHDLAMHVSANRTLNAADSVLEYQIRYIHMEENIIKQKIETTDITFEDIDVIGAIVNREPARAPEEPARAPEEPARAPEEPAHGSASSVD